eukprot:s52_g32.t1
MEGLLCLLQSDRFLPVCTQARQVLSNSVSKLSRHLLGGVWICIAHFHFRVNTWCDIGRTSGTHVIIWICIRQLKFRCGNFLADPYLLHQHRQHTEKMFEMLYAAVSHCPAQKKLAMIKEETNIKPIGHGSVCGPQFTEKPIGRNLVLERPKPWCKRCISRSGIMTMPKCAWIFADDPVREHEIKGHWGNPLSVYAKDRNAMPNGFRHEVMIRRLALRLDEGTPGSLAVRVALRQENGRVPGWAWPEKGLPVRLVLKKSLFELQELYSVQVLLTHTSPVASVSLPFFERAEVLTAESLGKAQVLSAFARLDEATRYGLLFPLPHKLREASLLEFCFSKPNPQLILPMAVPPPEVDDIEFHDPNCWASTGVDIWDPGLVLAAALPQLLDTSRPLAVLELGAGLSLAGFVAALLGHDCVSTDADNTIAAAHASGAANAELLESCGCRWKAEVIDWRSPPEWVMDRHWDVLLGGDLGWSAAREFALTRGLEQMLQNPLLRLLSHLRFDTFVLAERERDLEATEDFFQALECCGFEAKRLPMPKSASNGPLTDAVDITLWSVRHVCLLEVQAISVGCAAACLAEYLAKMKD